MAYRIVYGPEPSAARRMPPPGKSKIPLLTVGFFLLFLLLVRSFWPEGQQTMARLLFPGEPGVTETALGAMVSDLEGGAELGQAFTAFCQEVLSHGGAA